MNDHDHCYFYFFLDTLAIHLELNSNFYPFFQNCTVPGGLTLREGTRIIDRVFESGRLCGLDIVEVCPKIGDAKDVKTTVDSAVHLITAAMGNRRSGNLPSMLTDLPKN